MEEYEEQRTIQEYIRYVESIKNHFFNDFLTTTRKICEKIVNEVPIEKRGEITAALRKFVNDAERAELSTDYKLKEEVIDSFQFVINSCLSPGTKWTPEILIITTKMFSIFAAAKKLEKYKTAKFISASKHLESLFSSDGISRNQGLFDMIRRYKNRKGTREEIIEELLALKV